MRKGILFCVLVLFVLQLAVTVNANELTDDYFDIATNYFNSNNYAKAIEYLDLILAIEPKNVSAKTLRDRISPPAIDEAVATQQTAKVLSTAPNPEAVTIVEVPKANTEEIVYNSDYYCNKGQEFYNKKDFDSAVEYFHKSVMLNKNNAQAYNNLAMAYWCKNNQEAAIKFFKKAHSINKCYTQPLVNLSNLYKQAGDVKKQLEYLRKAICLNQNDYLAYYWLADYYKSINAYPQAISNYSEVIKINPKFPQAYLSLAMCYFETEEFNLSISVLNQYREFYPDSDFAYSLMAKSSLALSQYDDAKAYIGKAIALNDNKDYQYELGKIDYYMGDYQDALDIFQNVLQLGESAEIFNYVGLCHYKLENIEIAIVNFKKAIELDGLRPIYYYNLAQCYKSLGDKKNYVKYANTATKITPVNYQDFIDLSYIYYDNGSPSYAINFLNNAIKRYPNVKSLYLSKLKIYEVMGDNLHYNETKNLIEAKFNINEKKQEEKKE